MAAKEMGMQEVPCIRLDHLTDKQRREYMLVHNQTTMNSGWDFDLLMDELDGLDFDGFDFGLPQKESKVIEDDYDEPAPEVPKAKYGEVYKLGNHRLMCGDSTNAGDVKKLMGGLFADMLLTDPPYNVDYTGKTKDSLKIKNDKMEDEKFREFLSSAFANAKNSMKKGAAFHIWHAGLEGYNFIGACRDAGLLVRQVLIWVKNSCAIGRQDFQWKHEPALYGENPLDFGETEEIGDEYQQCLYGWVDGKHYWYKNRKQTTVLEFDRPTASKEHPTMKPIKLFDYEMKCNSKPGDIVLDLFGGSGTTIMAAEQNGRVAYVMEFDPRYIDVIIDRWEKFTGEKAKLVNG